jgi:hypothetical protein
MKYCSGDEVKLFDSVEYMLGGFWLRATVVFIEESKEAADDVSWLLEDDLDWLVGRIAIKWDEYDSVKPLFFATAQAPETSNASLLFTDTDKNEDIRLVSRGSLLLARS